MITSHPLTLTMKAWPNCQKNICLFVWSFPSSLYYISGGRPWYTSRLKPSAARRELFLLSVIWILLKGFLQAGSYWNLGGGFLQRRTLSMSTDTNTSPIDTQYMLCLHPTPTFTHKWCSFFSIVIVISFLHIVIVYTNVIIFKKKIIFNINSLS